MATSATPFVSPDEISRISVGSYEQLISRLTEALSKDKEHFSGKPVQILGTFSGHAVVLSSEGKGFRVHFEDKNGLSIKSVAPYPIQTFESSQHYLRAEALKAADSFLKGRSLESAKRLGRVVGLAESRPLTDDIQRVDLLRTLFASNRSWKSRMDEWAAEFEEFLGQSVLDEIEKTIPAPRFAPLYEGLGTVEVEGARALVTEAITKVGSRLKELAVMLSEALTSLREAAPDIIRSGQQPFLRKFEDFSQSLRDEVLVVQEHVASIQDSLRVSHVGQVHDLVVGELSYYEVASRYATEMTTCLVEASSKK